MTFTIDTGETISAPTPKSASVDDGQVINLSDGLWAERAHRQIIEAIESCEDIEMLKEYMRSESVLLDAFYMDRPEFWALIDDAHETQRALLARSMELAAANTDPAEPGNCLGIKF